MPHPAVALRSTVLHCCCLFAVVAGPATCYSSRRGLPNGSVRSCSQVPHPTASLVVAPSIVARSCTAPPDRLGLPWEGLSAGQSVAAPPYGAAYPLLGRGASARASPPPLAATVLHAMAGRLVIFSLRAAKAAPKRRREDAEEEEEGKETRTGTMEGVGGAVGDGMRWGTF